MIRAFQWDLARQVERFDWLLEQLPRHAAWGYQELYLHLEDAVDYPSVPGVARPDAYSYRQLGRLVSAAEREGIRVVPIVNLLGHTQYLIKVPELRDLNELRGADGVGLERGQVCPVHPRILEVVEKLVGDMAPFCTAGKIHVGLDESFHLGRHPASRAEISAIGLAGHFAGYVRRLQAVAASRNLALGIWADMLALIPDAIDLLPSGISAYDWYYYPFEGRPRLELRNFAEYDLAAPLRGRGIAYWGCPMNGAFRREPMPVFGERLGNLRSWWRRCAEVGAAGFLVTSWEPSHLGAEMTTLLDAAAASLWLDPGIDDATAMLAKGFERVFPGVNSLQLARRALGSDDHAFVGYARWEINERWDSSAGREGTASFGRDERFYARLGRERLPAVFAASAAWCEYLGARDVFVREGALGVFQLRRLDAKGDHAGYRAFASTLRERADAFARSLREGRRAARALWARTRNPRRLGPNGRMIDADERRLRRWRLWLDRAARNPALARGPTLLCGAWQLRFIVHNIEPALQKIVVERGNPDGTWEVVHERFMIEFRAAAARPKSLVRRETSVPLADSIAPLRIGIRGLGRAALSAVELTDGIVTLRPKNWPKGRRKIIGTPAPRRGFPQPDWTVTTDSAPLIFKTLRCPVPAAAYPER